MRIAVVSDIHSNVHALCRVLEDISQHQVDRTISLGDNVGYGPDPCGVIQLLKGRNISAVLGNHELALLDTGYRELFRGEAQRAIWHAETLLSRADMAYIAGLPFFLVEFGARFVHGLPPDSVMAYLSRTSDRRLGRIMTHLSQPLSFVGHTHLLAVVQMRQGIVTRFPMGEKILSLDKAYRYIINAGSVGQSRDGDDRPKYVIWDTEAGTVEPRYVNDEKQGVCHV